MELKNFPSEVTAAKRWINNYASEFKNQPVTLLGDDLYSRQPIVEHCLKTGMNFIFTCLPESHTALYDWLNYLENIGEVKTLETFQWHKRSKEIYRYQHYGMELWADWVLSIIALKPHKRLYFQRGFYALSLMQQPL